jgi:hypothetical protein
LGEVFPEEYKNLSVVADLAGYIFGIEYVVIED